MPKGIERKNIKGWKTPENSVYVGPGSRFENPFKLGRDGNAQQVYEKYAKHILPYEHGSELSDLYISTATIKSIKDNLAGKDLVCWCKEGDPYCHRELLLKIANEW